MIVELYNKIKEQNRFSDIFKPISKEEKEVRLKKRLEESDYEYLYTGDIRGIIIWTGPVKEDANRLVRLLESAVELLEGEVTLSVSILEESLVREYEGGYDWPHIVSGFFLGSIIMLRDDELDELNIADRIERLSESFNDLVMEGVGKIEIENVEVSNLSVMSKEDK